MTDEEKPKAPEEAHTHDHDHDHDHDADHNHGHDHAQNPSEAHTKDMSKDEVYALHTEHALLHMNQNDLEGSWQHFSEALKVAEELDDKGASASTLGSMGHLLLMNNEHEKALDHYTRALENALEAKDSTETARSYHNLGTYYEKTKEYTQSIENLLISLAYQKDAEIDSKDTQNYLQDIRKTVKYTNFKETAQKVYDALPADIRKKVDLEEFTRDTTIRLVEPKAGRNDPCTCGSGKKFKKCCGMTA